VKEIEKRVLRIIGEDTDNPDVYTDANITPIRDSVNDAIEEMCTMTDTFVVKYRVPIIADTYFYKLAFTSAQFCYILRARLPDKGRVLAQSRVGEVADNDYRWLDSTNTPSVYFPIGVEYVGFYPIYSENGHHVELDCAVLPLRYSTDDTVIQLRDDFKDAAAYYAAAEYFLSVADVEKYGYWFAEYSRAASRFGFRGRMSDYSPSLKNRMTPIPRPIHGYI